MHCVSIAEFEVNLDCHVLRVHVRWSCVDLDRAGYHAVDAGFWVVLELIIRWIRARDRSDRSIIVDRACSFFAEPESAV